MVKRSDMLYNSSVRRRGKKIMVETRFEEILVKKYPKLIKTIKTQNSRKMTNSKLKKKKPSRYNIIKLLKTKDKKEISKAVWGKKTFYCQMSNKTSS